MNISDLSVRRPVLATVFSLVIVLVGLIAFVKLPVREYPDIDPPVVTITTAYPGANSKVIETEITDLIEEELSSVEDVRTMTSTSRDQVSAITVEFTLGRDLDLGAQDIREKISRIRSRLPDNAEEPIVAKADSDAQPMMWIKVKSDKRSLLELSDYVEREVRDVFQTVPGVSKVILGGERRRSIQVLINPKKLAAYGLTVLDIDEALKDNNVELPSGRVLSRTKEFSVNVYGKLTTVEEYKNLIIKSTNNSVGKVRLQDVAQVLEGAENDRSFVRFNGQQGFGLGVLRQPGSNSIQISKLVREKIDELNERLPEDIILESSYDAATFINYSIQDVYKTILLASLLVILIIFVFLRSFRATLVPAVSIPVSLIGVLGAIWAMGFTINLMTLLGMVIAVGIVVDDSIIVLENIYRYVEEGMNPEEAAHKGAREITLAVIATTLVLVSIFIPVTFMEGITGRLLSEFAFSLSFATIISSFVALSLAPMLCSKILVKKENKPWFYMIFEKMFTSLEGLYSKLVTKVVHKKNLVISVSLVGCVALSAVLFQVIPKDFIPDEDRGAFFVILQTPRGSSLDYMDQQVRRVENILQGIPEMYASISVAAFGRDAPGKVTEGIIINRLQDWKDRDRNVFAIVGPLFGILTQIPDAFVLPIFPKSGPSNGFGSQPIQLVLKSNDIDYLVKSSAAISQRAFGLPSIKFARTNLSLDKPELTIDVNRDKALELGVSMRDISRTLEVLFTGIDLTEFNDEGENYKVIVQVPREQRENPRKLGEVAVRSNPGGSMGSRFDSPLIQLSNLIKVRETVTAEEISHHNRKKSVTIQASPNLGFTPAQGLAEVENLAQEVIKELKDQGIEAADLEVDYLGTSKELKDSNAALYFGFIVALIFAYLFLAGQFESFIYPIVIMLTVPLAIAGALLGLYFLSLFPVVTMFLIEEMGAPMFIKFIIPQFKNISINIYSQIGIIMLIAMASKNGILLVEFINQLREQGMGLYDAIIRAARLRLRPILMTAFSTILGIMPIALALGVGSGSRQSMGVAVVAGMAFATVLTLFVVPCGYALVSKKD